MEQTQQNNSAPLERAASSTSYDDAFDSRTNADDLITNEERPVTTTASGTQR